MESFSKPGNIAKFLKKKLLGTAKGSVDTLNWLVSCWNHFSVDKESFAVLEKVEKGEPILKIDSKKFTEFFDKWLKVPGNVEKIISNINIVGGSDTNLTCSKSGNTFTINVYYK